LKTGGFRPVSTPFFVAPGLPPEGGESVRIFHFNEGVASGAAASASRPPAPLDAGRVSPAIHEAVAPRAGAVPPDTAACPDCLAEMRDPASRRYRYPFTSCAACGPRFTIATGFPYERSRTSMAAFRMCPECQAEYDSPGGRRFHSQSISCPVCGPSLELRTVDGERLATDDMIALAGRAIADGLTVALKGPGGFQLVCDASSEIAVRRLRAAKHDDERPFAVMAGSLEDARVLGVLTGADEALLASPERPIVLVARRKDAGLAPSVAPRSPLIGLLLPSSPLHYLLMDRAGRPLVVTSGNAAGERPAQRNDEALDRLHGIADVFLLHDREIICACDDSIARVIAGAPVVLRRARGFAPGSIRLPFAVSRPILGAGSRRGAAFCLAYGEQAVLAPHVGDLAHADVEGAYAALVERLEQIVGVRPDIVAHDLDPEHPSGAGARARSGIAATVAVQHHHAHIASVMADNGMDGQVLGLAYDGGARAADGTSLGGELLLVSYASCRRIATCRPLLLPGGRGAIREPWRLALSMIDDAFGGDAPLDAFAVFGDVSAEAIESARRAIGQGGANAPSSHALGWYFDAFGALLLDRPASAYDGQIALALNLAADPGERGRYRYEIDRTVAPWRLDLRPTVRDVVFESLGGESAAKISARLHNTLAGASADLVRAASRQFGRLPVALSGGCFQNARLAESVAGELSPEFQVVLPHRVPPGDGGLALGQVMVADAIARSL
jgi:hydrogenase maturation protein HypF